MMFTDAFRNDAAAKVTGRAKYTDDYKLPDMLYAVPLHSQVASAIIKSIDYSEALKQKGVVAVYTAKDIPGKIKFGQIIKDCHTIINRRIRSAGDVIALVVAESREIALSALPLIKVETIRITRCFDPEEAIKENSPIVNPDFGSNICNYHKVRTGDIDKGEKEARIWLLNGSLMYVEHSYLEPETALCFLRQDGVLEVLGSMQHPFSTRRFVASHFQAVN